MTAQRDRWGVAAESGRSAQASQSRVTAHFEVESPRWETIYEANDVVAVIHQRRLAIALSWVDAMRLPAGTQVLELGCGAGLASVALAERGFDVQATDVVDAMMELAHERVQRAGLADRAARCAPRRTRSRSPMAPSIW